MMSIPSVPPGFSPLIKPTIPLQTNPTNNLSPPNPQKLEISSPICDIKPTISLKHKTPQKLEIPSPICEPVAQDLQQEPMRKKRGRPSRVTSGTVKMGQEPVKRTRRQAAAKAVDDGPCLDVVQHQSQCHQIDKVESEVHDGVVQVGPFRIKAKMSHTLQAILHKHGNIAKAFELESAYVLSAALESICSVVQELETTKFHEVTQKHVEGFYSVVRDAEKLKLDVKWLREGLDRICQTLATFHHYKQVHESLKMSTERMKGIQETLELKKAEMNEIIGAIQDLQGQLESDMLKTEKFCSSMDDISSRWNSVSNTFISIGLL